MKLKKRINYRHFICAAITLGVIALGVFVFPYALGRLIEGFRDFGLSIAYYFCELFSIPHTITPTVNNLPVIPFFPFPSAPVAPSFPIPDTYEKFTVKCAEYWRLWASVDNLKSYLYWFSQFLFLLAKVVVIILPIIFALYLLLRRCLKTENNDYNKDSKALRRFKWLSIHIYRPVKNWICSFITFIITHKIYWKTCLILFLFYFNAFTIFIEFLAFYFYFVVSFDFVNIYRQVYKLFIDLTPLFNFVPLWGWGVGLFVFILWLRRKIAYARLNHMERKNCGFINARPIVYMVCGTMGKKKTTAITDMALSQDIMLRDKAFEKILENDLKFPFFPWINLENALKKAMANHTVYNLATCKAFIAHLSYCYHAALEYPEYAKSIRRHLKKRYNLPYENRCFGYDINRYGMTYNDKLKVVNLWSVLETYAQLYFIYVIQSTLIIGNYSIRTDSLLSDIGNFPMWNSNFFKRDSRLIDSFSRHAHILDFDMLRLGRKVIAENPNKDAFEFGVVVITEVGKERGNTVENKGKKKTDDETNQLNDLFNSWLKMVRHSATVDNFPFVKVITDEQRPESWGADARDLCEIIHIRESGETMLSMPFFTLTELLYSFLFGKFTNLYYEYRYLRSDNTLPMHLLKAITAKLHGYYTGVYNTFGYCALSVQVESGTQDGQYDENKYYLMHKKIYSKRFSTDCFSDFFTTKALRAPVGINDLREYLSEKATLNEMLDSKSYFINDLTKTENTDND